jgi:hypothetical protein
VSYVAAEARQEMLHEVAEAIGEIGAALGALGAAYELLDDDTADTLEAELFRPVQTAYGRAQRTYGDFAARHGLTGRSFDPAGPGPASSSARDLLDAAVDATTEADAKLGDLQDSLRPVEVGDPEFRAGLAEVRTLLGTVPARARRLESLRGR